MNVELAEPATSARRMPSRPRAAAILATTIVLLVGLANPAQARPAVERAPFTEGLFYGDLEAGILMFAGGTAEDFCNGDEPVHDALYRTRRDGTVVITVAPNVVRPLYLYSSPLGSPEFMEATCAVLDDGDPATVPQEPFATGDGRMRLRVEIEPDGTKHAINTSWGVVASDDGSRWRVRGRADLTIIDGVPVGSPTEFQSLRVVPLASCADALGPR